MTRESVTERYLRLGLRLGRHVDGLVDAYLGPPELATAVEAEPPVGARALVTAAEELLEELDDGWLRDQVAGLRTYAGTLAGEQLSYSDEVEGCYGVRPAYTDEAVFNEAHEQLAELLPGTEALAERYARWRRETHVPAEHVERVVAAVIGEARAWTAGLVDLPDGEGVELTTVHDEPWMAFCEYLGDFRSSIEVNVDLPTSASELLVLAMHETYPGHHAERTCKERLLVRDRGLLEETLVMVPTPQSLLTEGIAGLAPSMVLESDAAPAVAVALRDAGVELDLDHALAVERALEPCQWAEVNAALMLHEDGAGEAEAQAYVERWGLLSPELSGHLIRFLHEPTSRTYVMNYPLGRELCRAYVAGDPDRFGRLLTEQVRVRDLLAARGAAA